MFRLRRIFLFVLVVAVVLPAGAQARSSKYCRLLSPAEIGRAVHKTGVRMHSSTLPASSRAGSKGRLVVCDYQAGATYVGQSSVFSLPSAAAAQAELRAQVRDAESTLGQAHRVGGPWNLGYQLGKSNIFVAKGRFLFRLTYEAAPKSGALGRLAEKAASRL